MKKIYLLFFSFCFLASLQAQLVVFDDDYASGVSFEAFGGSNNNLTIDAAEARPGSSGTKSLKVAVPAGGYTGGAMVAAENRNATAFNAVSFWVKASKAATLNVAGIGNNAGASNFATELNSPIALTTTWMRVIIPIPDPAKLTGFNGLWHFAEGSDEGIYTIWMDDIQYENIGGGAIGAATTASMNSQDINIAVGATLIANNVMATIPVNAVPVVLKVGSAFPTYTSNPVGRITFDATGVGTAQTEGAATVTATLSGTALTGTLNVTVLGAFSTPAPVPPARMPEDVVSLFSDPFTSAATITLAPWSPAGNTAKVVTPGGNNTLELGIVGGDYHGFSLSNAINLTDMQFLHYDIWIAGNTNPGAVFNTTVSYHAGGHLTGQTTGYVHTNPIAPGQEGKWLSFDIPFASFNPNLATGPKNIISEIVFSHTNASAAGPIYIDNIYFYRPGILPVKLTSFSATAKANIVGLNWETATEINNRGFGLERSSDGRTWSELTFVNASPSNVNGAKYSAADLAPIQGMNFYRLRQTDLDGKFSFSSVRQVNFNSSSEALSVYPNPSRGFVNVLVNPTSKKVNYTISNMTGMSLQSGALLSEGNVNKLNIQGLPAGVYMLQIRDEKGVTTTKIVVQ